MSAVRYTRGTGRVLEFGNWELNLASPLEDEIGIIEQSPELGRGVLKFTRQCIWGIGLVLLGGITPRGMCVSGHVAM